MFFALMVLLSLAVIALVLFLEHRGDPQALEREYHPRHVSNKSDLS